MPHRAGGPGNQTRRPRRPGGCAAGGGGRGLHLGCTVGPPRAQARLARRAKRGGGRNVNARSRAAVREITHCDAFLDRRARGGGARGKVRAGRPRGRGMRKGSALAEGRGWVLIRWECGAVGCDNGVLVGTKGGDREGGAKEGRQYPSAITSSNIIIWRWGRGWGLGRQGGGTWGAGREQANGVGVVARNPAARACAAGRGHAKRASRHCVLFVRGGLTETGATKRAMK